MLPRALSTSSRIFSRNKTNKDIFEKKKNFSHLDGFLVGLAHSRELLKVALDRTDRDLAVLDLLLLVRHLFPCVQFSVLSFEF